MAPDSQPADTLTTLQNVVASAARITQELLRDPMLPRLLDVFARMPAEDRETVLVLEREVELRNLSRENQRGLLSRTHVTKPNPSARLYVRVSESEPATQVAPEEIVAGMMKAARVIHEGFERSPEMRRTWEPAIVEGLRRIEPAERDTIRRIHQRMLDLLDDAERRVEDR